MVHIFTCMYAHIQRLCDSLNQLSFNLIVELIKHLLHYSSEVFALYSGVSVLFYLMLVHHNNIRLYNAHNVQILKT